MFLSLQGGTDIFQDKERLFQGKNTLKKHEALNYEDS
jgi:hypothetical protein